MPGFADWWLIATLHRIQRHRADVKKSEAEILASVRHPGDLVLIRLNAEVIQSGDHETVAG